MAKSKFNKKKFNQQANKSLVKIRSKYKAVNQYEAEFKARYGQMMARLTSEFIAKATKMLNPK